MHFRPIGFILGYLIAALGALMSIPTVAALRAGDGETTNMVAALCVTVFVAGLLILGFRPDKIELDRRQGFVLTSMAWVGLPLFGALPLYWSGHGIDLTDAYFESVSGITTTGSTVLSGLDDMAPSLLLWRSMLQWIGGIGIIAMGFAVLPFLRVGGIQILRMESSDRSDKVVPRATQLSVLLVATYVGLSMLCAFVYWLDGMTAFDAINHAMTTISTGGFSTHDASFAHFGGTAQWSATLFMALGSLPFTLYILALRGRPGSLWRDSQVRVFLGLIFVCAATLALWLVVRQGIGWSDAIRLAAFNVTSVVSTTGFADGDFMTWGAFAVPAFFFLIFVGGCSGSTSGGLKIYRIQLLLIAFSVSLHKLIRPHGVFEARYGGKPVQAEALVAAGAFAGAYFSTILLIALFLGFLGVDFDTAISGAATAVANVGPGVGPVIGPAGNFATLPDAAKWALALGMIMGRLEIVTLAVLFAPAFWRH